MALEAHALLGELPQRGQAEDLEAAAVGEEGPAPAREPVEAAELAHERVARAQHQVVGVGEDDLRAHLGRCSRVTAFTAPAVPTGMKTGVAHLAVGGLQRPGAGAARSGLQGEGEGMGPRDSSAPGRSLTI